MVVDVMTAAGFDAASPRRLFSAPGLGGYGVSPDGRRFVMVRPEPQPTPAHLNLVVGWFDELKQKVSGKK